MRRSAAVLPLVLLALFAAGCDEKKDLIRLGMLNAPVCYLGALGVLSGLRWVWRWRGTSSQARPVVLALPFLLLFVVAWLGLGFVESTQKERSNVVVGALILAPFLVPIIGGALCVPLLLLWRIWFAIAPRTSYEGAAVLGTLGFFAPGFLALFGFVRITSDFVGNLSLLCFYLANGAIPLLVILVVEALLAKGRAPKAR